MAILASSEIESSSWRKMIIFWVALSILFWGLITLYLGSTFDPSFYQSNISINVVNFDRGNILGETFRNVTKARLSSNAATTSNLIPDNALGARGSTQAGWYLPDSDTFPSVDAVIKLVRSGTIWGAIVVNPSATANLQNAANAADPNYDPRGAITIIYDEGRNPLTVQQFVVVPMRSLALEFQTKFTLAWISSLTTASNLTSGPNLANLAAKSPAIISVPASWTEINLAKLTPQNSFVTFAGLSIGLLLLIIFTYAAVAIVFDITEEFTLDLAASTMVSLRLRLIVFYAVTMSLFYALAMAAFKGTFSPGTWFAFWILHFLHLLVHALTFLTLAVFASPAIQAPLFLFILVVNITAALGTPELSNQFYVWSYGMPMYAAVTGSRTLLFGGYPNLGDNFGALLGWTIGFIIVYVFFQTRAIDRADMNDENDPASFHAQRSSTLMDLEKSLSGTLRASRQFSFRDSAEINRAQQTRSRTSFTTSEDEFRGSRRARHGTATNNQAEESDL